MWIHLLTLRLIKGASPAGTPAVVADTTTQSGVRRARFLRRGPKLPWEEEIPDEVVTVTEIPSKRKRIKLPKEVIDTIKDSVPIEAANARLPDLEINIPSVGKTRVRIDYDEETAIVMALLQ